MSNVTSASHETVWTWDDYIKYSTTVRPTTNYRNPNKYGSSDWDLMTTVGGQDFTYLFSAGHCDPFSCYNLARGTYETTSTDPGPPPVTTTTTHNAHIEIVRSLFPGSVDYGEQPFGGGGTWNNDTPPWNHVRLEFTLL
ncbi:MAG: hypothetical protein KAG66_21195, partial [Methylococcales bacterium]|nr:hypothetical protein [Methylococcales bacterium]